MKPTQNTVGAIAPTLHCISRSEAAPAVAAALWAALSLLAIPALAQLLEIREVAEVYSVAGEYDLVAILRVKEYSDMAEVVPGKLQRVFSITQRQIGFAGGKVAPRHGR